MARRAKGNTRVGIRMGEAQQHDGQAAIRVGAVRHNPGSLWLLMHTG